MDLAAQALKPRQDAYWWRLLATGLCFAFFGVASLLVRLTVFPLLAALPGDAARRQRRARLAINRLFRLFIGFMRGVGVFTFSVEGAERLGRPGQMIIANHPSLIDVVVMLAFIRDSNCVVKQSLLANPFTRKPMQAARYIGNSGSLDMLEEAARVLQEGQTLIVFPEGTRTTPGQPPQFHRGAAAIALRGARVLTPVTISVSPTTLTKAEPWYRIPHRRFHFQLRVGADIDPQAFAALGPVPLASRKLNDHLHQHFTKELALDEHPGT